MAKRKVKEKKKHRVYCTYFPDGRYYIGYSCKTDKQFEKYFGSSTIVKEYGDELKKEIIKRTRNEYIEIIRLNKLPIEVVEYICEFLVDKSNNNKCLNKVTCGCYNCVMDEVYQEYSQDYSEEEYCNGYDKY